MVDSLAKIKARNPGHRIGEPIWYVDLIEGDTKRVAVGGC